MKGKTSLFGIVILCFSFYSCEKEITLIESNVVLTQYDSLSISSNPLGAKVYINGRYTGYDTPCKINWIEGDSFLVSLKMSTYLDAEISITPENIHSQHFYDFDDDDRNFGEIYCSSVPSGADIYLNDINLNKKTSYLIKKLRPGIYQIKYKLKDHIDESSSIRVEARNSNPDYVSSKYSAQLKDTSKFIVYASESGILNCNKVFIDNAGKPWFCTVGNGIYTFVDGMFKRIYSSLGMTQINCIFQDSKGSVWFGTGTGLIEISSDGRSKLFNKNDYGFKADYIYAVCEDINENIWVATTKGVLYCDLNSPKGSFDWHLVEAYGAPPIDSPVNNIVATKDGTVWASISGTGAMRYKNGNWTMFTMSNSNIPDRYVKFMSCPNGTDVYFTSYSKIFTYTNGAWKTMANASLYYNNGIYIDSENNIFNACTTSIVILKNDNKLETFYTKVNGYSSYFNVRSIGVDKDKNVWLGTSNYGIVKLKYYDK